MNKDVDCQVFGDQLDGLVRGDLPAEGERLLRLHAGICPACAMQLRVQEHLAQPSLAELEARVPEELLASLWPRVEGEVGGGAGVVGAGVGGGDEAGGSGDGAALGKGSGRRGKRGSGDPGGSGMGTGAGSGFRWLVPALAAAALALLFSTGFLTLELHKLQDQEALLAQQVAEQQRWLSELEVGANADPVARTAALAGRNPWLRALGRQESISIQGLRVLLGRMPGDRMIMTQAQLDAALRSRTPLGMPLLREVLTGIEGRDGVRVRDLIQALDGLEVGPDVAVPTADLVSLLS